MILSLCYNNIVVTTSGTPSARRIGYDIFFTGLDTKRRRKHGRGRETAAAVRVLISYYYNDNSPCLRVYQLLSTHSYKLCHDVVIYAPRAGRPAARGTHDATARRRQQAWRRSGGREVFRRGQTVCRV